ncbi:MAG: HNH endonuclease [Alphaproteobacteria bacterium]|nr:HNH endonuclease [Alphaproteobacteria bacterium]
MLQHCLCQLPLDSDDELWDIHHIKPKSEGGSNDMKNLTLLHLTCHEQIHLAKGLRRMLHGVLSVPEPHAWKLACSVLRGLGDGDIPRLPDITKNKSSIRISLNETITTLLSYIRTFCRTALVCKFWFHRWKTYYFDCRYWIKLPFSTNCIWIRYLCKT